MRINFGIVVGVVASCLSSGAAARRSRTARPGTVATCESRFRARRRVGLASSVKHLH